MNAIVKRLKSKTYWAAILGASLTVLEANVQLVTPHLPEALRGSIVLMWPVLMLAMRELTFGALDDK